MTRVVPDAINRITGEYNPPSHNGVDIGWENNEELNKVHSNCKGVVIATLDHIPHGSDKGGGWGNYVLIRHDNGMCSRYAHLKDNLPVKVGDIVDEKSVIGIMGETGIAYGRHLHFEVSKNESSYTRIDPTPYLEKAICEDKPIEDTYYKVIGGDLWLLDANANMIRTYPDGTIVKYLNDGYDAYGYHYYYIEVLETKQKGYMASAYLEKTKKPEPQPTPSKLKIGDKVEIIGEGNSQASGKGGVARGIGYKRQIQDIYENEPFPYQVGNEYGTTGFYKREALKKL